MLLEPMVKMSLHTVAYILTGTDAEPASVPWA